MEQAIQITPLSETQRRAMEDQITELSGNLSAATYRLLVLIREFDDAGGWHGDGIRSLAHWLSWRVGTNLGAAREKIRTARALADLPKISKSFSEGRVSFSKVRAMTRVATPENEDYLLQIAKYGTASHVEKLVRLYRKQRRSEALEKENKRQERCSLKIMVDDDGMVILRGRFTPEQGATIIKALDAGMDEAFEESRKQEKGSDNITPEPYTARRADAMERLAECFLSDEHGLKGGDKYQLHLTTDIETLQEDGEGVEVELKEVGNVSAESARRMSCDCSLVHELVDSDGEILNVGRKTRTIPPALRRALEKRDQGCRFPGCTCKKHVDGHHIIHWSDDGETKLSNLVLLCRRHHRLVHEGGFDVTMKPDGKIEFTRPDGSLIPTNGDRGFSGNVVSLLRDNRRCGTEVDSSTIKSRWLGERMDYDIGIYALWRRDHKDESS